MIPPGYEIVEGVDMRTLQPRPKHVVLRWLKKTETKGGVLIPETRQRAHFMKGQLLAVGPECDPKLQPGLLVEFNGISDKEFLGVQDPVDRDTVFVTRFENVFGLVIEEELVPYPWVEPGIRKAYTGKWLDMIGSWLMVRPDEQPQRTASGLLLPAWAVENGQRQQQGLRGQVLSAGGFVDSCRKRDRIAFNATQATKIHLGDHNDEVALVIDNDDVLAVEELAEAAA